MFAAHGTITCEPGASLDAVPKPNAGARRLSAPRTTPRTNLPLLIIGGPGRLSANEDPSAETVAGTPTPSGKWLPYRAGPGDAVDIMDASLCSFERKRFVSSFFVRMVNRGRLLKRTSVAAPIVGAVSYCPGPTFATCVAGGGGSMGPTVPCAGLSSGANLRVSDAGCSGCLPALPCICRRGVVATSPACGCGSGCCSAVAAPRAAERFGERPLPPSQPPLGLPGSGRPKRLACWGLMPPPSGRASEPKENRDEFCASRWNES